jgi:hypothetical protein
VNRPGRAMGALLGLLMATGLGARPAWAQMYEQFFEITVTPDSATVGDTVVLQFRMRLSERDLLVDTTPALVGPRLREVQILSIDPLVRGKDGAWQGTAKALFFRTGHQEVPRFGITFTRIVAGIYKAVLTSAPASVEIRSTLPPGDQPLRDIRPLAEPPPPRWPWLAVPAVVGLALWLRRRARHRPAPALPAPAALPPEGGSALEDALDRLAAIEREQWPSHGQVDRHYEEVANVVRDFVARLEHLPARELTTSELLRALAGGARPHPGVDRCHHLLAEADLVKFAATRPGSGAAGDLLIASRELLVQWPIHQNGAGHAAG